MNAEAFECSNCFHSGPLNIHGRCEACNSESVISQEKIALMLQKERGTFLKDNMVMMRAGAA